MTSTEALKKDDDLFLKKRISYDHAKYMRFEKDRNFWKLLDAARRHLFPTEICEGSPSRVTMIDKNPAWKKAYQKLLKRKATPQSDLDAPR